MIEATVFAGLALLAVPIVTGWLEGRDPDAKTVARMADRDRQAQAVRPMSRRMMYAKIEKPILRQQYGRPIKG